MNDYRAQDRWIFGGIWNVLERKSDQYVVDLSDEIAPLIGRLIVHCEHRDRATRCKLESYIEGMSVETILPQAYAARPFPGLSSLTVTFAELEGLIRQGVKEWREPLSAVKGIYLLRVARDNANYVGAANGEQGIWGRWSAYAASGHGGNVVTTERFGSDPIKFAREEVSLTLLEAILPSASIGEVATRERHWMTALGSTSLDNLNSR